MTIDGKQAYLWFVSPTQINAQAPDDATTGPVTVVVTTPFGTARGTVTLAPYGPTFSLLGDGKHVRPRSFRQMEAAPMTLDTTIWSARRTLFPSRCARSSRARRCRFSESASDQRRHQYRRA